ncbi:hypothetical protein DIRU0_E17744 [Diutina rugosa]
MIDIFELWCKRTSRQCPFGTIMNIRKLIQLELLSLSSDYGTFYGLVTSFNWEQRCLQLK